ncbi:MAG: hypothetical protein M3Y77_21780 [Actinomycetota bacterium]|nr:hypothetical protein [Actinomycetota bacterium]
MKRTTAVAAMIAAAGLMLAGCSKESTGTPSAGSGAVAGISSQNATSAAPGASDSGSSSDSSPSSDSGSSSDSRSSSDSGSSANSSPKETVGGGAQGDAATTTWFTAYCGGLAPLTDMASAMPSMDPSGGPDAMKKSIGTLYKTFGDAMTNTSAKLKDLPAPSFSGGDKFASTTVTALSTIGKTFEDGAAKIQAASATDLQKVMTSVTSDMSKVTKTLSSIYGNIAASPDLLKVFGQIPACKKLGVGG